MDTIRWTVIKPRGPFTPVIDSESQLETNSFSVKEIITLNRMSFLGEIYSLNLNSTVSIYNLFNFRILKAYYALLVKTNKNGFFKIHIIGTDIPMDIRFSDVINKYYTENEETSSSIQEKYIMMIDEENIDHFKMEIYNRIQYGPKVMFDMMMSDYMIGVQNYTTNIFRNLINSFLGTGQNPFSDEVHRVITENDLSNLPHFTYSEFIDYCKNSDGTINQECFITLNDFKEGDEITVLPCKHAYISSEIKKWLKENSNKCPVCRKEVGEGELVNIS